MRLEALRALWNAGATVFDGIALDVTDTASAASSRLLNLLIGGVSKFSVNKAGLVDLVGGGIVFPAAQIASAGANTLDDYEEGTWTPSLLFGGGNTGLTYSSRSGRYTKIGRLVHIQLIINLSAKGSSTGTATIAGLPFASAQEVGGAVYAGTMNTVAVPLFRVSAGSDITLLDFTGSALSNLNDTDFNNASTILLFVSYTV